MLVKPVVYIAHREYIPESPREFTQISLRIIRSMLLEALEPFSIDKMVNGKKLLIKPNFVRPDYQFNPAVCTDPRVILALGSLLREAGAKQICVGDNPGVGLDLQNALVSIPGYELWQDYGIEPFFFQDSNPIEIELPQAKVFKRMTIPAALQEFELLINLPKIKMHMHVGASLGIKNLYGLLMDQQRMTFHRQDVNLKLIDILRGFTPDLTVLEGIWALEGQAPICGEPVKDFNTIIAGENPLAVDTVGAAVMGIEPIELATNRLAQAEGWGSADLSQVRILGAPLDKVMRYFKRPVVSSMGAYANCAVYEFGACVGCMSSLRHALDRLHYGGVLSSLPDNTFVLGIPGSFYQPMDTWEGDLWLIGDCPQTAYHTGNNVLSILGCPPHFAEIIGRLRKHYLKNG